LKIFLVFQLVLMLLVVPALSQDISVNSLLPTINCTSLEVFEGTVWAGTAEGGLLRYLDFEDGTYSQYTTADGLSGNSIKGITWTGEYLWAICQGADLTRLDVSDYRFSARRVPVTNDWPITSITGWTEVNSEKVYYGLQGGGVGFINSGLVSNVYVVETSPGLVSDDITCLENYESVLWLGTSEGISKFSGNVFTDLSESLPDELVNDIFIDSTGQVYVATAGGAASWNEDISLWEMLGDAEYFSSITMSNGQLIGLCFSGSSLSSLHKFESGAWVEISKPEVIVSHIASNSSLIASGKIIPEGAWGTFGQLFTSSFVDEEWDTHYAENILFTAADGIDFTSTGELWVGDRYGRGISRWDGDQWLQFYTEVSDPETEGPGLIEFGGNILTLATSESDNLWASNFTKGLIKYNPDTGACAHVTTENSSVSSNNAVKITSSPDGSLIICSDQTGADVLLDEENWEDPLNWINLSTGADQLNGSIVRDAEIGQYGQIWFAVEDVGIVLWDYGLNQGDPTWNDTSDDVWTGPLIELDESSFSFTGVKTIAVAKDGTIWAAGGSGVVHFRVNQYSEAGIVATHLHTFREKTDSYTDGLLAGRILELDIDFNGDIWVSGGAGVNRIRLRGDDVFIDSYTSYRDFVDYGFGVIYSEGIISGVPGGMVYEVKCNNSTQQVAISGDRGVMLIDIPQTLSENEGPIDNLYLFPNPLFVGAERLVVGGVDVEVDWVGAVPSGGISLEIFNLTGQSVYRNMNVESNDELWDGTLREGSLAAPGVYQVRIEYKGQILLKPLAVVR
jgi:ligand-binding sensor domain-containing protein